ncbi:MAG: caspase family protein [Elusimicrobia bacterium]|nr:caspase family protein [Elusimicrobiota bacterium]
MMMKAACCAMLALAALAAGCAPPPVRQNTWTSVMPAAVSPYAGATAAVVYSENTKSALEYLRKSTFGQFDPDAVFASVFAAFDKDFKRAVRISRLEEAKGSGADVVIVVDFYAVLSTNKFSPTKMDVTAAVLTLDGRQIDRLVVHSESRQSWSAVSRPYGAAVEQGAKDLGAQLEERLTASSKLQDFLGSRQEPPAARLVAASPAPAPALPVSPSPGFSSPERPDDLAVIVGIESYSDIPAKAPYAERDADAFKAYVRALGVPERNIALLKGSKAGRASLVKNVEQWLPRLAKADSRVYFYFSGHGAPDVKTGLAYLVPWDGDPNFLESTAYPVAQLYRKLGELPAKQVLVAMDSCFSGMGGRSVLASGARPLIGKVETGGAPAKLTVLAASAANEISGSLDDKGHGAFTYFLLQGLGAGKTTPKALADYLTPRVQDEARRLNRDQTPQLQGDGSWSLR